MANKILFNPLSGKFDYTVDGNISTDTKANILAGTATAGKMMYATDTYEFYLGTGSTWYKVPFALVPEPQAPDMGYLQDSSKIGYGTSYITDKAIANSSVGSNANTTNGSIRFSNPYFQVYANSRWNNVVMNFVFKEDSNYGYTFEHQPVGFTSYIEIMSGNSLDNLGLNGLPIIQGYKVSMGAYPFLAYVGGGTIT